MIKTAQKKVIIIKPSYNYDILRLNIEKKLNKLYPSSDLYKLELDYDLNIDDEFQKQIDKNKSTINYNLIKSLPSITSLAKVFESDLVCSKYSEYDDDILENNENEKESEPELDIDIDISGLEKEYVGDKWYYFDHIKGIIYDTKYNPIGNIDDMGEINIES